MVEAAAFLRLRPRTLDNMRCNGVGPIYCKHGGRILYNLSDLIDWSNASRRRSTTPKGTLRADSIAAATVAAVIAALIWPPCLLLVWNTTPSIPIGLYVITPAPPRRGDLSVMRLPRQMETLAVARAILTSHIPVLKPVAATAGDRVCRSGRAVTINGHLVQSLVTSIAKDEPCRRGKDVAGFRAAKSSFWLGTPIASIAVTTARYN